MRIQYSRTLRFAASVLILLTPLLVATRHDVAATTAGPLTFSAPTGIDHQPLVNGISVFGISCADTTFCAAVDAVGNVVTTTNPTAGAAAWTAAKVDNGNGLSGISCPSTTLCVAVDHAGNIITSTNPTGGPGAWTVSARDGTNALSGISCPNTAVCVAADQSGNIVFANNPLGGAGSWTVENVDAANRINGISCPSTSLCAAVDDSGNVVTSANPVAGASTWTSSHVDATGLQGISCTSPAFCVAVDHVGSAVTSTNPIGGASAWKTADVDGSGYLLGVSCTSTALCVAVDYSGNAVASTNPTGGASAWTASNVDSTAALFGISCVSNLLCVAVDYSGNVVTSTQPSSGGSAWTLVPVDGVHNLSGISCPSPSLCVTGDDSGNVVTSTNPTGGASSWTAVHVAGTNRLNGVGCASAALCVVVGYSGNVVTSTNPAGGASAWTVTNVDGSNSLRGISCPSTTLCVAVGGGHVVTSTNPAGGASTWTVAGVAGTNLTGIACATTTQCVAVDAGGKVVTSNNPTGGSSAWTASDVDGFNPLLGISCAITTLCVAVDGSGNAVTSTDPRGGSAAWSVVRVDSSAGLSGVSCTTTAFCVAADTSGNVVTTSGPTGGAAAWTVAKVDGNDGITGVSCPSSSLCVAVDRVSQVIVGILTPTLTTFALPPSHTGLTDIATLTGASESPPAGGTISFSLYGPDNAGCTGAAASTSTRTVSGNGNYASDPFRVTRPGVYRWMAAYSGDAHNVPLAPGTCGDPTETVGVNIAVLPAMANGAYGGYVTAATIQNKGGVAASVSISYFDQTGAAVGTGDSNATLPANAGWTVRQDNGHGFAAGGAGSAIVYSTQPIASFVNEFPPGSAGDATSYTGVPVPSGVGTTLYAPTIVNNAYGGYTTGIGLLNEGGGPTNVSITYRDGGGTPVKTQTVTGLAANAYQALYSGEAGMLPDNFAGTATITATQTLGAIVNETGPGGQFSSYTAVASGSTSLNAPAALSNAFGGYNTGMGVQNTSASAGSVSITYFDSTGSIAGSPKNILIPASGALGVYQGDATNGPPSAGAYTALIQSELPLAAIVNEVAPAGAVSTRQSTSYNTFPAGTGSVHLPLVENSGTDPWNTGEGIMNTGTTEATVTVAYFNATTGAPVGTALVSTLAAKGFLGVYQPDPSSGLPVNSRATAVVTAASGGQLALIANESSATSFMSYGGQ